MFQGEVGVEFQRSVLEADEDLVPLVEGVADGLGDIAAGELRLAMLDDETVEFFGDGSAAGAPMERSDMDRSERDVPRRGATGGEHQMSSRQAGGGLAGLFLGCDRCAGYKAGWER